MKILDYLVGSSEERGMVPNTELKKMTIGLSGNLDIGERITAGINLNYFNIDSDNIPISGYNNENPFQQFIWSARQVNFSDLRDWKSWPAVNDAGLPINDLTLGTAAEGTPLNWNHNFQNNPYWVLETNTNTLEKDRVVGNINVGYQLNDWLSLTTKVGIDSYQPIRNISSGKRQ